MKSLLLLFIISIIYTQPQTPLKDLHLLRLLNQCKKGEYLKGGVCLKCSFRCLSCQNNTGICTQCEEGYRNQTDKTDCFQCKVPYCKTCQKNITTCDKCMNYYYLNKSKCERCGDNCMNCTSKTNCLQCEGIYLYNIYN